MKMDYQLVLQFACNSEEDFDSVIQMEDQLASVLGDSAIIDGHDSGSGQANIFIFTSSPVVAFNQMKWLIESNGLLQRRLALR